jgi:hypothetical protein
VVLSAISFVQVVSCVKNSVQGSGWDSLVS